MAVSLDKARAIPSCVVVRHHGWHLGDGLFRVNPLCGWYSIMGFGVIANTGALARRRDGATARWRDGAMARWRDASGIPKRSSS
jgi:hypothetical protein